MKAIFVNKPERSLIQRLIQQSKSYPMMGDYELQFDSDQVFAVVMRQEGEIVAGAITVISCDWAYPETVWVAESLRGQGIGRRVMRAAESYALDLELKGVYLYTTDFQAPKFYPNIGYHLLGRLADRPQGYTAHYFYKTDLSNDGLTDDFVIESPVTPATLEALEQGLIQQANDIAPIEAYERVFVLQDKGNTDQGGLFGHEFWGWFDVHLCYAESVIGLDALLDALEIYCDQQQIGIMLNTYDEKQNQWLIQRGYQQFGVLPDRPIGKTCNIWVRSPQNM